MRIIMDSGKEYDLIQITVPEYIMYAKQEEKVTDDFEHILVSSDEKYTKYRFRSIQIDNRFYALDHKKLIIKIN